MKMNIAYNLFEGGSVSDKPRKDHGDSAEALLAGFEPRQEQLNKADSSSGKGGESFAEIMADRIKAPKRSQADNRMADKADKPQALENKELKDNNNQVSEKIEAVLEKLAALIERFQGSVSEGGARPENTGQQWSEINVNSKKLAKNERFLQFLNDFSHILNSAGLLRQVKQDVQLKGAGMAKLASAIREVLHSGKVAEAAEEKLKQVLAAIEGQEITKPQAAKANAQNLSGNAGPASENLEKASGSLKKVSENTENVQTFAKINERSQGLTAAKAGEVAANKAEKVNESLKNVGQQVRQGGGRIESRQVFSGSYQGDDQNGQNNNSEKGGSGNNGGSKNRAATAERLKTDTVKVVSDSRQGGEKAEPGRARGFEQVLSNFERLEGRFGSTFSEKASETGFSRAAHRSVSKQIQQSLAESISRGQNRVDIRLNPPEMGRVTIKLQEKGGEITGLLEFSKAQARSEIERALPQMIRNIEQSGTTVKKIEVVLSDKQADAENPSGRQLAQQQDSGQEGSGYPSGQGESGFREAVYPDGEPAEAAALSGGETVMQAGGQEGLDLLL